MRIPPTYKLTPPILEYIARIESFRLYLSSIPIPAEIGERIQRISLLKSSLFSARIEGNTLLLEDLESTTQKEKKQEVMNIFSAIKYIAREKENKKPITKKDILTLHQITLKGLQNSAGYFRKEMGAIFNEAGVAIYLSPPPSQVSFFLDRLLSYINSTDEKFPLISAFLAHLIFEKIHPFIDGNGRVGRLLIPLILSKKNYLFHINISLEEYLDSHKNDYYYYLNIGQKNPHDYLLFMLKAFYQQTEHIKQQISTESDKKEKIYLPLRQEEIYFIIKDHRMVSFDNIRRRFLNVPERTLRYDLKKLQDKKIIRKIGVTKGSWYTIKD